jgi:hypothetical protein
MASSHYFNLENPYKKRYLHDELKRRFLRKGVIIQKK